MAACGSRFQGPGAFWWKSGPLHTQWDSHETVEVCQIQFLTVVDSLELDKLKQEASCGRW